MNNNILVIGASGYIGRHLVPKLLASGYSVTAGARNPEALNKEHEFSHPQLVCQYLDLEKPDTLAAALEEIDTVFYLVHGMMAGSGFYQYETRLARHFMQALKKAPVKRIIYLGALLPESIPSRLSERASKETTPSQHLQARKVTGDILRESGCQVIELRSGIIIGPGSAAFEVMRDMVYHLPVMTTPKWVRSRSAPIALEDLLFYLEHFIQSPVEGCPIIEIGGPEALSYEDQMRRFARLIHKPLWIIKVPFLTPALSTYWLHLITSVPTPIASALIRGLAHDLLPDPQKTIQKWVSRKCQGFDEAVKSTLARENQLLNNEIWNYDREALERWRPGFAFYPKQAGYALKTSVPPEKLWQTLSTIGGKHGYFYANGLWKIRAWLDWLVGGKGLQVPTAKESQHQARALERPLQAGDRIDSWKILTAIENRHLSLLFGMKAPGLGRLEWTIEDHGQYRTLDIRAWWHPAGFWGLLYWFAMLPAHLFIFRGMAKAIEKQSKIDP